MSVIKEWRLGIVAELIWDIAPGSRKNAKPWAWIEQEAVEYYNKNKDQIQSRDPIAFAKYNDSFITPYYIRKRHTAIRLKLMEQGRYLSDAPHNNSKRIKGIVRTREVEDIERTIDHRNKVIDGQIRRRNDQAELANLKFRTSLPAYVLKELLLDSSTEVN